MTNKKETFSDFILKKNVKLENSGAVWQWLVLILYAASLVAVTIFHEPWFDEAQSWLIARDASIRDIIFLLPHYEGHPPLWHLYLVPFAKSGISYETGIKSASIILNTLAMGLLIFKAPFPKVIRFTVPFTYYFFYQYGVISRSYSLMMVGFILLAMWWKKRNQKPFLTALAFIILCGTSAYGIILSFGICLVWLWEIWDRRPLGAFIKSFIIDKRFYALVLLLAFSGAMILLILPYSDTFATHLDSENSFITRIIYMLFFAPLDATFFTSVPGRYYLNEVHISYASALTVAFLFLLCAVIIYPFAKKRSSLKLLLVPYIIFFLFSTLVYFKEHHLGIIALFIVFWLWASMQNVKKEINTPAFIKKRVSSQELTKIRKLRWLLAALCIAVSVSWSAAASAADVKTDYCSARQAAQFIKDNGLEDCLIMTTWLDMEKATGEAAPNINFQHTANIAAYFDTNIFFTLNNGEDYSYVMHSIASDEETEEIFELWRSYGAPDILLGHPDLGLVYEGIVSYDDYTEVATFKESYITKSYVPISLASYRIYIRNDLLNELDIK